MRRFHDRGTREALVSQDAGGQESAVRATATRASGTDRGFEEFRADREGVHGRAPAATGGEVG